MKAINKLKLVWKVIILSLLIPLFLFRIKNHVGWGIVSILILILFIIFRQIFFKKKNVDYENYGDYHLIPVAYTCGAIFLILAFSFPLIIIKDLQGGHPLFISLTLVFFATLIFGFLLIYYSYQAKKESPFKIKIKKPKRNIKREKIKF